MSTHGLNVSKVTVACSLFFLLLWTVVSARTEYETFAEVESVRQPDSVTLSFEKQPGLGRYILLEKGEPVGEVEILSVISVNKGSVSYRAVARYSFTNNNSILLKAGMSVALLKKREPFEMDYSDAYYFEEKNIYKPRIVTQTDGREMLLISGGKFILGSNDYGRDEYPEQEKYLGDFYMDKYEVSNRDYKRFADSANGIVPLSWVDGKYTDDEAELPVLVSYTEAEAYAVWAGKRLPSEEEWEKAARGGLEFIAKGESARIYPWGSVFSAAKTNCLAFWNRSSSGAAKHSPALMAVSSFEKEGASPYGIVNMSGNAQEWTSSWFQPYSGNSFNDGRYGTQYKVVKGGAYFSNQDALRASFRQLGGIPNLEKDNISGFRCVKNPTILEKIEQQENRR